MRYFIKEASKLDQVMKHVKFIADPKKAKNAVLLRGARTGRKLGRVAGAGLALSSKNGTILGDIVTMLAGGAIGRKAGTIVALPKANKALAKYTKIRNGVLIGGGALGAGGAVALAMKDKKK